MSDAVLAPTPVARILGAMLVAGATCGLLIAVVHERTRPIVERNRERALAEAVLRVLPGAETTRTFRFADGRFTPADGTADPSGARVHAGYRADGGLAGVAVEAAGMGYQDTIRLLWGYEPQAQTTTGLEILESRETPGLGDKIERDARFRSNFDALDLTLAPSGDRLANSVVAVAQGAKSAPWQIDGITGATVSSVAVARILDRSAGEWAPRIRAAAGDFAEGR